MKTTRIIINTAILIVLMTTTVFAQNIRTQQYDVSNYDKIQVSNAVDVTLVANGQEGVSVRCDERLLPAIIVEQRGEKLNIGLDWKQLQKITGRKRNHSISINKDGIKINGMVFNGDLQVTVYVKQVAEISTLSSGDVEWEGDLPADKLYLRTTSSGDITWTGTLTTDELYIHCSSSGDVEGHYKGKNAFVILSSSGDYEGDMEVETLDAQITSSGDFTGRVNAAKAIFNLSSSGDAEVKGSIDSLYVTASSSAEFNGKKIVYKYAEAQTASMANIYLSKSGKLIDKTPRRTGVFVN